MDHKRVLTGTQRGPGGQNKFFRYLTCKCNELVRSKKVIEKTKKTSPISALELKLFRNCDQSN
jgi:hypothetical protein